MEIDPIEGEPVPKTTEEICEVRNPFFTTLGEPPVPLSEILGRESNPKDLIASNKLPLSLVPDTMMVYAALAFLEGSLKYGRYNWRITGVRSSVYLDALKRHITDYENGEDVDPKTGVPHLANALACLGIILDAKVCDKLNDDRPPRALMLAKVMDVMEEDVSRLKHLFRDHHPHQPTIADSPEPPM